MTKRTPVAYSLNIGKNVLSCPGGISGSFIGYWHGQLFLWTTPDLSKEEKEVTIYVVETGYTLPEEAQGLGYAGTALNPQEGVVVHAYF